MKTTYTKLYNGSWGVRVEGTVTGGDVVTVTKKDGGTKSETVERVIWSGNGICLCSIGRDSSSHSHGSHGSRRRRDGRYECDECGEWVEPGTSCWETGMTH